MTKVCDHGQIMTDSNRSIGASDFRSKCLKLLDDVEATRKPLIITKRGKSVAQLVPMPAKPDMELFGALRGSGYYELDIIAPVAISWDAQQ